MQRWLLVHLLLLKYSWLLLLMEKSCNRIRIVRCHEGLLLLKWRNTANLLNCRVPYLIQWSKTLTSPKETWRELLKVTRASKERISMSVCPTTNQGRIRVHLVGIARWKREQSIYRVEVWFIVRVSHPERTKELRKGHASIFVNGGFHPCRYLQSSGVSSRRHVLGEMRHATQHAFMIVAITVRACRKMLEAIIVKLT